jgi:hypothetical protein
MAADAFAQVDHHHPAAFVNRLLEGTLQLTHHPNQHILVRLWRRQLGERGFVKLGGFLGSNCRTSPHKEKSSKLGKPL